MDSTLIQASLPTFVKTLNGTNYEDWKESLEFYLAITNMDLALREEKPKSFTNESTAAEKASYEKWEHSNRKCLMVMKYTMEKTIRESIPESNDAKEFLKSIGEKFKTFEEPQKCQYLSLFVNTKYDGVSDVREHVMKLMHYYYKLKSFNIELGESTLIWQVLESLPPQFGVLKTFYNTQKIKWTLNEMIAIVTSHNVQVVASTLGTENENKGQKGKMKAAKAVLHLEPKKKSFKGNCKYCKNYGHKVDACFFLKKKLEK